MIVNKKDPMYMCAEILWTSKLLMNVTNSECAQKDPKCDCSLSLCEYHSSVEG